MGLFGPSKKEREFFERLEALGVISDFDVMKGALNKKGYEVSEIKFVEYYDCCIGEAKVYKDRKNIGIIYLSVHVEGVKCFDTRIEYRNSYEYERGRYAKKEEYFHAIHTDDFESTACLSLEPRKTDDIPEWLLVCAECYSMALAGKGDEILKDTEYVQQKIFESKTYAYRCYKYLNVMFRKGFNYKYLGNDYNMRIL